MVVCNVVLHLLDTCSTEEEKSPGQGVKGAEVLPVCLGPQTQSPRQKLNAPGLAGEGSLCPGTVRGRGLGSALLQGLLGWGGLTSG